MEQMMIEEVKLNGTTEVLGIRVPKIEGGFGSGSKCVLAKTIAELHNTETRFVNQLINNNIDEFEFGIDIIDLKIVDGSVNNNLESFGLSKMEISKSSNIYLLSEQGFMLLVGFMKTEQAKVIRKEMRRNYFTMREIVNSNDQLKAMALLKAIEGKNADERLSGLNQYTEIKVLEETTPLIQKIELDAPKVDYATTIEENLATTMLGLNLLMQNTMKEYQLNKLVGNDTQELVGFYNSLVDVYNQFTYDDLISYISEKPSMNPFGGCTEEVKEFDRSKNPFDK